MGRRRAPHAGRHGRIDVLVNNAGIFQLGKLVDTDLETYRRIIDVNQVGVFLGMRAVAPIMIEQRSGSIINISSVAGLRPPPARWPTARRSSPSPA